MESNSWVNLHLVLNKFINDSRVLKETKSIADSFSTCNVLIFALWESGNKKYEELSSNRKVWRVSLITRKLPKDIFSQSIKYLELLIRIIFKCRRYKIKVVHCHDLLPLPIGLLFKILKKSKVIYDAHELETEVYGLCGFRKKLKKIVERFLIKYVDYLISVSDSIINWYIKEYGIDKYSVILNVPYEKKIIRTSGCDLKKKFKIKEDEILYIYIGGLFKGRYLENLLSIFSKLARNKHLILMGKGKLENLIKEYQEKYINIHLQPAVKPEEVILYTSSADVGITLGDAKFNEIMYLSRYFALPNKLFEYVLSGLPVIVNDYPERGKFVDNFNCGWKVDENDKSLSELLGKITMEQIINKKKNILNITDEFSWAKEEEKLINIYKHI